MRLRWVAIAVVFAFSVVGVYAVCRGQGGAVNGIVDIARRITWGALMGVGFWAASHVLQQWMSQPIQTTVASIAAQSSAPAPPVPLFEVAPATEQGRYRVRGFDRDTHFETIEFVFAESPSNAQVKVELKGVEVAAVERAG